ncbi:hypothetical protein D3H65_09155 [Paraflavitalea soli]|uniref:DUF4296 domain-containing protein n=1 Tax=Paraflavitalea soli TaxID=2315862 RepID=A0A3B7MLF5_9BACT|nr:hypothetical protein [Paraflavitalea soli]AXY74129.1 hypothetical protein D3H65_09155 [Paraflavitalea soli]
MKKKIILYLLIGLPLTALCRQELSKQSVNDSTIAQASIATLKKSILVQPEQEAALYQALLQERANRRQVFKQYWRTPQFRDKLAQATYQRDSIYQTVLGKVKYLRYRQQQQMDREQFELQQQVRTKQETDSLTNPTKQP